MPDQSQGACQSIEDAAALGIIFGRESFQGDVREALEVYEQVRKPRATKVQAASARARENINERIGLCAAMLYYFDSTFFDTEQIQVSLAILVTAIILFRMSRIS